MIPFAAVDVADLVEWIGGIDWMDWPQQNLPGGELKPAMMTDLGWHGFGARTDRVVAALMAYFHGCEDHQRMLSVVMPGHTIEPHRDEQAPAWKTRVHVPLTSNDRALFILDNDMGVMRPGNAYLVDTRAIHAVHNGGDTPRVHFMFDVRRK